MCKSCIEQENKCTACRENFTFREVTHTCEVDEGFYLPDGDKDLKPCDKSCKACTDKPNLRCTLCFDNYNLVNGKCLIDENHYESSDDEGKAKRCS